MSRMPPQVIDALAHDYQHDATATVADLARRYGVSVQTLYTALPAHARRRVYRRQRTITADIWRTMYAQHAQGMPWHAVAAAHNVAISTIYDAKRRYNT